MLDSQVLVRLKTTYLRIGDVNKTTLTLITKVRETAVGMRDENGRAEAALERAGVWTRVMQATI